VLIDVAGAKQLIVFAGKAAIGDVERA
jgi:hypothetical protein